jgi:4-hydroxybenzoate polyprenyltransferase
MVIDPFLAINGFNLQLSNLNFTLLVLATILIAAGGYAINDYFDTKTDRVNKPDRVVIDRKVSRQFAINLHTILTILGVLAGGYISFHIKIPALSFLFILSAGLLWFYSTNYKRQFLIGNLIVSMMIGTVPMIVVLFEIPLLNREYGQLMINAGANFNYIFYWVAGFSFFAFYTNLIREIIKDTEDFEGDSAYGMNTFPIQLGIPVTKLVVISLIVLLMGALSFVIFKFILFSGEGFDYLSSAYFTFAIFIPLLFIIFQIAIGKTKRDYHIASQIMKVVMLAGVLYSLIVYYTLTYKII